MEAYYNNDVDYLVENGYEEDGVDVVGLLDYFGDVLDIEYRVSANKEYKSVLLTLTCGGPNIYLNTADAELQLYWGGDKEVLSVPYRICEWIDEGFKDIFSC